METNVSSLIPAYRPRPLTFERGIGSWLFTQDQRYLDFTSGMGVLSLGHAHPSLLSALGKQARKLWHVSNLFTIPQAEKLAKTLCDATFGEQAFFCNSGTEAIEGALKLCRKYHAMRRRPRSRFVVFSRAFHGRTFASLAAGEPFHQGFEPLPDWFDRVPFGDLEQARKAIDVHTAGILIEPIQGEGGIHVASQPFLQGLRRLADKTGALLIFDEIQCGMGRSGTLFAYQQAKVTPDILAIAKGLGGGFPIGAFLAKEKVTKAFSPGSHGTTFGGNPLAMAVGSAVLEEVFKPGFLARVRTQGSALQQGLQKLARDFPSVFVQARGVGLMQGLQCVPPVGEVLDALCAKGLLLAPAAGNVVRLLPPLTVESYEIKLALETLQDFAHDFVQVPEAKTLKTKAAETQAARMAKVARIAEAQAARMAKAARAAEVQAARMTKISRAAEAARAAEIQAMHLARAARAAEQEAAQAVELARSAELAEQLAQTGEAEEAEEAEADTAKVAKAKAADRKAADKTAADKSTDKNNAKKDSKPNKRKPNERKLNEFGKKRSFLA